MAINFLKLLILDSALRNIPLAVRLVGVTQFRPGGLNLGAYLHPARGSPHLPLSSSHPELYTRGESDSPGHYHSQGACSW